MPRVLNATVATLSEVLDALKADGVDVKDVQDELLDLCSFGDAAFTLVAPSCLKDVLEEEQLQGEHVSKLLAGVDYIDFKH